MWLSSRLALISATLVLVGCGYQPVSVEGGAADGLRGSIEIADPVDPDGAVLVQQLERRLGLAENPEYRLFAEIRLRDEGIGFTPDEAITRYNVEGRIDYRLQALDGDRLVTVGQVQNFTSYSATSTPFATQVARRDARSRLMVILADQLSADLLSSAPDWRE